MHKLKFTVKLDTQSMHLKRCGDHWARRLLIYILAIVPMTFGPGPRDQDQAIVALCSFHPILHLLIIITREMLGIFGASLSWFNVVCVLKSES